MAKEQTKRKVAVLGATGMVGQRFIQLLQDHAWFEIACIAASERSSGQLYKDTVSWRLSTPIPPQIASMRVCLCTVDQIKAQNPDITLVFSALDASVAGKIEEEFASAGCFVFSNAKSHRFDRNVPILVPMVNPGHLELVRTQTEYQGFIVTNANCSSTGLVVVLKALYEAFGLEKAFVCTMQALSGAGYPGVSSMDALDNVVPYISGEEDKLESEPLKILGNLSHACIELEPRLKISAHCNRVAVIDGHTECLSVELGEKTNLQDVVKVLEGFKSEIAGYGLPSFPAKCIRVCEEQDRPQPRMDREQGGGFTVSVGRVRECPLLDYKLVLLSHNTILGAAGNSILSAELAQHLKYI